jgi:sugar O-acyltransferase (sialic acid O-acetyltransferase NeuD family)
MIPPLIVFGAGGHARVVLDALREGGASPKWVIDDNPSRLNLDGVPILSSSDERWTALSGFRYIVAIGDNRTRAQVYQRLLDRGGAPVSVRHPSAVVSGQAEVGEGVVVLPAAVVNPGSRIGMDSILNTSCSVDHDCCIGNHVHICPGVRLAGEVTIGASSMVGTGATVLPRIRIGTQCLIGAGAVVHRDIPDLSVAVGVPARVVRRLEAN